MIDYWLQLTFFKMGFWITWTIIPVIVEIIPAMLAAFRVYYEGTHPVKLTPPAKLPVISILVPVYNSEDTLFACLDSIAQSTYPDDLIQVIVADNQSTDNSFQVFAQAQNQFETLHLSIIHTAKGKAQALNVAMYNAIGTYIINIDSDGQLEPHAFLSGRTIESRKNQLFTMSGAFSAFRRDVLYRTFMYNTDTVGEDTDMTFQIRQRLGDRITLCHDAIFYIEPISGWAELYTQRQRWQRGELESIHRYTAGRMGLNYFFNNFLVRRLMIDHTFMFPKMIWFFASFVLLFFRYSAVVLIASYVLIYFLYILVELLNFICVRTLLHAFDDERHFYDHQWWTIFTLPGYNLVCFWFRLIGTINMMVQRSNWNSQNATSERHAAWHQVKGDAQAAWRRLLKKD